MSYNKKVQQVQAYKLRNFLTWIHPQLTVLSGADATEQMKRLHATFTPDYMTSKLFASEQ